MPLKKKELFYIFKVTVNGKKDGKLASSARNKAHAIKKANAWTKWVAKRGYPGRKVTYIGLEKYRRL